MDMNAKYRLLLITLLLLSIYYTFPWFSIFFIVGSVTLDIKYLYATFIIFYILLEYREYNHKRAQNEFYHFFFWFSLIISAVTIYIITIQAFNYYITPKDFIINTVNFKLQIIYTTEYKLYYIYKYFEVLVEESRNIEDTLMLMPDIEKAYAIVQNIDVSTIVCYVQTLEGLREAAFVCSNISLKVFYIMSPVLERFYETTTSENLFYCIRNLLIMAALVKTYANTFDFVCYTLISSYIQDYLYIPIYNYLISIGVEFDPTMTMLEIYDVCKVLASHMLRKWESINIIRFFWKWR